MTDFARKVRELTLQTSFYGHDGNLQSVFSSIDIICALYENVLAIDPKDPASPDRDYFVLSKGQATMGLLAVLAAQGFFPEEELKTACKFDSRISMQADRTKLPGIEISAGSLGHGFPMAAGIAYALKNKTRKNKVYILAGDGEMNEGTMWEAALFVGSERLSNLTLIIDDNNSIQEMLDMGSLESKLTTFGFECFTVNGHDQDEILSAVSKTADRPKAIIAKTRRGYGSKTLMENREWFHRAPNKDELNMLLEDVRSFESSNEKQCH